MTYSLNEIEVMAKRAVRGAGYHWGYAEEAGKAIRWLAERDLPGCSVLVRHFQRHQDQIAELLRRAPADPTGQGDVCPLIAGAYLCDRASLIARGETFELKEVASPLLLLPYGAAIARLTGDVVEVQLDRSAAHIGAHGFAFKGEPGGIMADRTDRMICRTIGKVVMPKVRTVERHVLDDETLTSLSTLGARTFAPATEASRLAGAGAGLTDNE